MNRHEWNNDGERCVKCGAKYWMGGECSSSASPAGYSQANPTKCAVQIAYQHRQLMDAMTQQGPSEIAAALDNMECAIQKARQALGLGL